MFRDTRLAKLDAPGSQFSCILLATAGLVRLGLGHRITQRLDPNVFPYAVGQGALGIEVRTDSKDMQQLVRGVDHGPSRFRGLAERAMLRSLQGGCSSPIGVYSSFKSAGSGNPGDSEGSGGILSLHATVLDVEGKTGLSAEDSGPVSNDDEAERLGISVAKTLLDKGAKDLLVRES